MVFSKILEIDEEGEQNTSVINEMFMVSGMKYFLA
jgi:hypothetical protein